MTDTSLQKASKLLSIHPLDELTGGAFSAPTSGERAAKVRAWLAGEPSVQQIQEVFKELSARDKGAARSLREKLDEIKRSSVQVQMVKEWADRAQALLDAPKLNIADALAWQRDAAKAGAPLSKEPLAVLRAALNERTGQIEDLQHRAQVAREAAILIAQRVELLSTKPLAEAQALAQVLGLDVQNWVEQTSSLHRDAQWPSVDLKFTPQLETAKSQLMTLWEAFSAALAQASAALADSAAPLPQVPVWAQAIRAAREDAVGAKTAKPTKPKIDPEKRALAHAVVREVLSKLEQELAQGHGKASAQAAADLRLALKAHGDAIDERVDAKAREALAAAGEMEGWQQWRANQIREDLIVKAQALVASPLSGRKQQEAVRALRDAWKQTDQGGVPNHGMWRKFDEACNEAHKIVEAWLDKVKAEEATHKAQRTALIEEIHTWAAENSARTDWKQVDRELHAYAERWRNAGHIGEKAFAQLQPLYKAAMKQAHEPLELAQQASLERRRALIEQARALGAESVLRIDAVKALQASWQAEAQTVPMDRKEEQKLWDAFRKPIDEAFERKGKARQEQAAAMSAHDQAVLDAAQALDAALASGDAKEIRAAMQALEAASQGKSAALPAAVAQHAGPASVDAAAAPDALAAASGATQEGLTATISEAASVSQDAGAAPQDAVADPPKVQAKPLIARRGDDRPGAKLATPSRADAVRPGGRRADSRSQAKPQRDGFSRADALSRGKGARDERTEDRAPRLSHAAFVALREGMDKAQLALKKLAGKAHGEAVVALLLAWQTRSADGLPSAAQLGRNVAVAVRNQWVQALTKPEQGQADTALLRLEMAAQVPTPAEHLDARRALQLQLLTQRHQAQPLETWVADTASVLAGAYDEKLARRLQAALKVLLH